MAIQAGMVPLSIGLIAASAFVLAHAADRNVYAALITAATAAVAFFTRINPLWVFLTAGVLGLSGGCNGRLDSGAAAESARGPVNW